MTRTGLDRSDIRVLTVVSDLGMGGTQRVAQNYAIGLAKAGLQSAVLTYSGGGQREADLTRAGIPTFVASNHGDGRWAINAALQWQPDIIHIHRPGYPNENETRLLTALRVGGAKVVETNVFARFDWTGADLLIDAHLLLNIWCYYKWASWGGRRARRKVSYVLPNAVDIDALKPIDAAHRARIRHNLGVGDHTVLFGRVGQPIAAKWSTATLDAFSTLVTKGALDVKLLLVGCPPDYGQKVASLPDVVRDRVILLPATSSDDRLAEYFSAMDIFLHASAIGESFGMVLCEAMILGVPVVTLSTPLKDNGQLEVVGHERGGLVALSKAGLPEAMERLATDTALRSEIAARARDWVVTRFALGPTIERLIAVYRDILSPGAAHTTTDIPRERWVYSIASRGIGRRPSVLLLFQFWLLHRPWIYRVYLTYVRSRRA